MPIHSDRHNVVFMYADDLGFGDLGCYGATRLSTPNLDRLAAEGLRFTNGYATAATCTPSRYSVLTGNYPWRNPNAHILPGNAPMIIPPGSATLPAMLQQAGYATAAVGKWHLGLGKGDLDWNTAISATPLDVGFDYSYIMAATNDRVPCVYIEGRHVVGLDPADPIEVSYDRNKPFPGEPTGKNNPELLRMKPSHGHDMAIVNGISRIGYMRGGKSALWRDEEMAEVFLRKAIEFVTANRHRPFFLYYAFHQPHVPRVPGPRFAGATGLGPRGDVIVEMDWCVGEMLATLDQLGLRENTIVIFTSDNGPVLDDGYVDQAVELCGEHRPAGPLRGGKYSLFDGGTRVPLLLRWPQVVKPGESEALVSQVDLYASLAALSGQPLPPDAALDSWNVLEALLGRSATGRTELVTEGIGHQTLLRVGDWVFIPPYPGRPINPNTGTEMGCAAEPQLYNLTQDIGQRSNLAGEHGELVAKLKARWQEIMAGARTRP
jgi:arylsulfatase A-like enzyme